MPEAHMYYLRASGACITHASAAALAALRAAKIKRVHTLPCIADVVCYWHTQFDDHYSPVDYSGE